MSKSSLIEDAPAIDAQRYELVERIAVGGMAEVFRAKTFGAHGFEKTLAIKRILPTLASDKEFEERFISEAKISVTLTHANIVQVLDFSRFGDSLYIVMEFVDGLDVSRLLELASKANTKVPVGAALNMSIELFKALDFAHQRDVIHRDVSPSNLLLSRNGEAKLADFGIAQALGGERHGTFRIVGKWPYMSPEQTRGESLDYRSDMFSAGALIYELFTGRRAFLGESVDELVERIRLVDIEVPSSLNAELPEGLDEIIMGLLTPRREERTLSAKEVVKRLVDLSYQSSIPATTQSVIDCIEMLADSESEEQETASSAILIDDIINSELEGQTMTMSTQVGDSVKTPTLGAGTGVDEHEVDVPTGEELARQTLASKAPPVQTELGEGPPNMKRTILTVVRRRDGIAEWIADSQEEEPPHPPTAVALEKLSGRRGLVRSRKSLAALVASVSLLGLGGLAWSSLQGGEVAKKVSDQVVPARSPVIALLPFDVEATHPDLDFASSGLPQLLGRQLAQAQDVKVLDYYRVLARLPSEEATPDEWEKAAREMGATILVRGSLRDDEDEMIALKLWVEGADDSPVRELEDRVSVQALPGAVRASAAEILSAVSGETVKDDGSPAFAVERNYQLGVAAMEKDDFGKAARLFRQVTRDAPDFADGHYQLALATWWSSVDIPEVLRQIDAALAGDLSGDKRAFLKAMRPLAMTQFPEAITSFRQAAEQFPDDKLILYGLFEALFHGGYPEESAQVYRRIREIEPSFRLGIMHPISYYASRNDRDGLEWAVQHLQSDARNRFWRVRAHVADGNLEAAEGLIESIQGGLAGPIEAGEKSRIAQELAAVYASQGQLEKSAKLVEIGGIYQQAISGWGLAQARGVESEAEAWRAKAREKWAKAKPGYRKLAQLLDIAPMEVLSGDRQALREMLAAIEATAPAFRPSMGLQQLRLMLTESLGSPALLASLVEELAESPYPVVQAEAAAFAQEAAGRHDEAVASWARAISHEGSGRFRILQNYYRARAASRAGDWQAALDSSLDAVTPTLFYWSWGSVVGQSHLMAARALHALNRAPEARAHYEAIVQARSAAAKGDLLVERARAGLAQLPR